MCTIHVPPIHPQSDGTGVVTGHVRGVCSFRWHSVNQIQYKDRWHSLGSNRHAGGALGEHVTQPRDREDYRETGYWREVVLVYDGKGNFRQRVVGPVSYFSS